MANALTDMARAMFARGEIDWVNGTFKAVLLDTFGVSFATVNQTGVGVPANLALIPQTYRDNGASSFAGMPLVTSVLDNGACDADDVTFTAVQTISTSGSALEAVVIYMVGVSEALSPVIAWLDTATGLPIVPNGGDIICTFDQGSNRLFRL